jgi:hypothetical protein
MKSKNLISILTICFFIISDLQSQNWQWAQSLGGNNSDTKINCLSKYQYNEILIAGSFAAANLSLGNFTVNGSGQEDGFVAITNTNGSYSWLAKIGGSGDDKITKAVSDPNGNIYVAGNFSSLSLTVGNITFYNTGSSDAFLVKFNADKSFAWARQIATAFKDEISGLAVDNAANVYIAGHSTENMVNNEEKVFIMKISAANSLLWEKNITTSGQILSTSLQTDATQNIYVSGCLFGTADFGNSIILNSGIEKQHAFIVKYSLTGSCLNGILSSNQQKINALAIGSNSIYSCGESPDYLMGWGWPLASSKIYVAKYNNNLVQQWEKNSGGLKPGQSFDIPFDIAIDQSENVYVCGYFFSDTLNFAAQNHYNLFHINYFYPQIFVFKYNSNGSEISAKTMGGTLWDQANSILVYGEDKYILGGNFESALCSFGSYTVQNLSTLDSIYVHLKPKRFGRKTLAFLANYDVPSAIDNPDIDLQQSVIYPNPANHQLFIRQNFLKQSNVKLSIYSSDMRLIKRLELKKQNEDLSFDISDLKSGIYFVLLENSSDKNYIKLIKK